MLTLRPAQWPQDAAFLQTLDTTFITDRVYRPVRDELSFQLIEEPVTPSLHKRYEFDSADPQERRNWEFTVIVEDNGQLAGFAAAEHVAWNRRVAIWHLYVMPAFRGQGVGMRLLAAVNDFAITVKARCLWLETQNVNYPAIQFYRSAGFQFCGFDASLYDSADVPETEVALFFARPVIL
jgi:ribosomal protein S18 acetylase RimI-like enzyme